ncbi:small acid-soluble spore protein Tlp [Paenibacillus xerothermodurans]|uniref:Small acid-soluble spore protein Tlp n=1 Tax=Paenibacillus xerothermodurans TaxID=1977292 RepID=A0A2W1NAV7_PAEXE|nr:small acid-soluble spore protein Tlp [Paenibacillus xerothermodurans]PZE21829.1 small acid-soluble spore protein Tlp [Paenibacillus xerothermodurans]
MPKPDNRADNVENIQSAINHTIENHNEAEEYLEAHADEITAEAAQDIVDRNERREASLESYREEIQDEAAFIRNQ